VNREKRFSTKDIVGIALWAVLYAVAVIAFAPISFELLQVRIADALMPMPIIFGMPAVLGLALGCVVANFYGGLGIVDIIGGPITNLIAGYLAWKIGQMKFKGSWFVATVVETIVVTLIVGSYLSVLFDVPLLISYVSILPGCIISMNILGYILLKTLSKVLPKTVSRS
jgi:uncharacterized membrane protein